VYSVTEAGELLPIRRRPLFGVGSDDRRARGNATNAAVNTPVQGSASVIQNKAITKVDRWLVESGLWASGEARICNAVHDATYLEVIESKATQVAERVQHLMTDQPTRGVPLRTDAKIGRDLASMVALKDWTG
jgi:DNA polymerase I-like protein with 3'-5' exonuclease and polymerase domains